MGDVTLSGRWYQNTTIIYPLAVSSDGALITVPYNTEATHAGKMFFATFYNSAVGAGANLDMLLVTSTIPCHFGVDVNAGAGGVLSIYEAATYSAAGAAVTIFNANRQSTLTSTQTITSGPTVTGTGTTLLQDYVPGGTTGNAVGGTSANIARITEFIGKASTAYLFRFNNLAAGVQPVSMTIGFFEGALT